MLQPPYVHLKHFRPVRLWVQELCLPLHPALDLGIDPEHIHLEKECRGDSTSSLGVMEGTLGYRFVRHCLCSLEVIGAQTGTVSTTYIPVWRKGKTSRAHLWGHGTGQHPPELTWGDLADSGRVPAIALVAVGRLDENSAVAEALRKDLPSDVVEPHTSPCGGQRDQPTGQLGHR